MHRLDNGQPIREAMKQAGLSIGRLADKTREVDPAGYGITSAAIGHMVSTGTSGRDQFHPRSCDLVARALEAPIENFFTPTPT